MEPLIIKKENVKPLLETRFIKVYDLQYAQGRHYYDATRRPLEELTAVKSDEDFKKMLPDAVSCFVILKPEKKEPVLLMSYEYRYPTGQFLLSPPAGLIDPEDKEAEDPLIRTARREIHEETGLTVKETDRIFVVNPLVFSTPGMTDECNGLVCAVLENPDMDTLSQKGAVGSERFNGFKLLTRREAAKVLKEGRDEFGHFYSVYTAMGLMYFVGGMWQEERWVPSP